MGPQGSYVILAVESQSVRREFDHYTILAVVEAVRVTRNTGSEEQRLWRPFFKRKKNPSHQGALHRVRQLY